MMLLFQICFFVGIGLTAVTLVLGNLFHITGIDGADLDLDLDLDIDIDADLGGGSGSLFSISPMLIIVFITVFGGSGLAMTKSEKLSPLFIILIAASLGIVVSLLIQRFVLIPLKRAQNTSAPAASELIGITAKVNEAIPMNGFGEITYVINGNSYSAPAKTITKEEAGTGTSVSICCIENHVFYVMPLDETHNM